MVLEVTDKGFNFDTYELKPKTHQFSQGLCLSLSRLPYSIATVKQGLCYYIEYYFMFNLCVNIDMVAIKAVSQRN